VRKLIIFVAALLALAVIAVPAFADAEQDIGRSGDVNNDSNIVNSGDNSNQCAAPLQVGNTGSFQNQQGFFGGDEGDNNLKNLKNFDDLSDIFGDNKDFEDLLSGGSGHGSDGGDAEFDGGSFEISPSQNVSCNQVVDQDATAVSTY
jgi:hypothetical protein